MYEGKPGVPGDLCGGQPNLMSHILEESWDYSQGYTQEQVYPDYSKPIPPIEGEWNLRFSGYAKDCMFQGIGRTGEVGDIGWLHCPDRPAIKCIESPEPKQGRSGWGECQQGLNRVHAYHCDWE